MLCIAVQIYRIIIRILDIPIGGISNAGNRSCRTGDRQPHRIDQTRNRFHNAADALDRFDCRCPEVCHLFDRKRCGNCFPDRDDIVHQLVHVFGNPLDAVFYFRHQLLRKRLQHFGFRLAFQGGQLRHDIVVLHVIQLFDCIFCVADLRLGVQQAVYSLFSQVLPHGPEQINADLIPCDIVFYILQLFQQFAGSLSCRLSAGGKFRLHIRHRLSGCVNRLLQFFQRCLRLFQLLVICSDGVGVLHLCKVRCGIREILLFYGRIFQLLFQVGDFVGGFCNGVIAFCHLLCVSLCGISQQLECLLGAC